MDVPELLRRAASDPREALVRLWLLLAGHRAFEDGMDPTACEAEARRTLDRLEALAGEGRSELFPVVHPAAAARAVDEYLARMDLGNDPRVRVVQVEGPGGPVGRLLGRSTVCRPALAGSRIGGLARAARTWHTRDPSGAAVLRAR